MEKPYLEQLVKKWKTQLVSSDEQDENPAGFVELFEEEAFGAGPLTEYSDGPATQCGTCPTVTTTILSCCGNGCA